MTGEGGPPVGGEIQDDRQHAGSAVARGDQLPLLNSLSPRASSVRPAKAASSRRPW
jgi:hypothetical protein